MMTVPCKHWLSTVTAQMQFSALTPCSPIFLPVSDSINDMIADGTYEKILKRWNLWEEAVSQSQINPPGLPKPKAQ